MNKYVVIQNSRLNNKILLILKERQNSKDSWWTSEIKKAKTFETKLEADKYCDKLKFNNPRVIPYDEGKNIIIPVVTYSYEKSIKNQNIFNMSDIEYKEWLGYSDCIEQGGGMYN